MAIDILTEVERLHKMGFALHWLRARSKIPLESGWTTGPRKTKDELLEKLLFAPIAPSETLNLGVRLGTPSVVGSGFLGVIDCDVKSKDPRHLREMEKRLGELFGEKLSKAPCVQTGRGNGSRHVYVVTAGVEKGRRLAQSDEKVKVHMPSSPASKAEKAELSLKEIASGIRLKAAWEIAFMGDGQQVVLPPSIHPDTGAAYIWGIEVGEAKTLPLVELEAGGKEKPKHRPELARNGDFHPLPVDLLGSGLPSSIVDMILTGEGCEDRSAGLMMAAIAMVRERFTDEEILTVLTDPDTYLGAAAFDHAKTISRGRAARWVFDYTLDKARRENDAKLAFEKLVEAEDFESPKLGSEAEIKAQAKELLDRSWQSRLDRESEKSGFRPKNTLKNALLVLRGELGDQLFKKNEFSGLQLYGAKTPWGGRIGGEISDDHLSKMKSWFADKWRFEPSTDRLIDAINVIASDNAFHPVRDYLATLEWDGKTRIDSWLKDYMGAYGPEPYLSEVSRKVLVAMVARVYEPGKKFDQVLILEGVQGVGKSTALRYLAGEDWFTDATINIGDKDGILGLKSAWLVEMGELSGMRKADVDQLKEFVSRTVDRIRVPYGRRTEAFPRQCIFVGTTNNYEYLKDPTGNRRFWPVGVGVCDFERIKADRDQLFAEAKFAYELGEALYLENKEAAQQSVVEQFGRTLEDSWAYTLQKYLTEDAALPLDDQHFTKGFTMDELFSEWGPFKGREKDTMSNQLRAGSVLRLIGYRKYTGSRNGVGTKIWTKK